MDTDVQEPTRGSMPPPPRWPPARKLKPKAKSSPAAIAGVAVLGLVLVALIVIAMRRSSATAPVTTDPGTPFKAQLVLGEGTQRQSIDAHSFETVTPPVEVSSRDLFFFGPTPKNVVVLPNSASLRFSDGSQAGIDGLSKSGETFRVAVSLSSGRVWVVANPEYAVTVTAKKAMVKSSGQAVFEVTQLVDDKAYAVTTLRVYKGTVEMTGQTKKSDRILVSEGQTAKVNDDKMFPAEAFDPAKNDSWALWNIAYVPGGTDTQTNAASSGTVPTTAGGATPATSTTAEQPAAAPQIPTTSAVIPAPPPKTQPPRPQPPAGQPQPVTPPPSAHQPPPGGPPPGGPAPQPPPGGPPAGQPQPGLEKPVYAPGGQQQPPPIDHSKDNLPVVTSPGSPPGPPPGQPAGQPAGQPGGPPGGQPGAQPGGPPPTGGLTPGGGPPTVAPSPERPPGY